jgi:collagenase-like PrtC family protease
MAENYYVFEFLKPYKNVEIAAGSFLYVANRYAVAELKEIGVQFATLALENSPDNMEKIVQQSVLPLAEICFDYPALFTSAVCIRPNDCQHCSKMPKQFNLKKDGKDYVAVSKNCQIQLFAKTPYERPLIKGITYVINRKSKPYL